MQCEWASIGRRGLYRNPWEKDDAAVQEIAASFKRQRTTFSDGIKERARQDEGNAEASHALRKNAAKSRAKSKAKARAKNKAKAK